ncbi:hypothetical protein [Streptomyces sp. AC555_RSS877]|nr:hypothetical protein [Streptomyces sp. AC555_RSS877]
MSVILKASGDSRVLRYVVAPADPLPAGALVAGSLLAGPLVTGTLL